MRHDGSMRILLCSLAVPWPSRPRLGIFHVHQAQALRDLGSEMEFFSPGPAIAPWVGGLTPRLRDHARRPMEYLVDGVRVRAPRTRFCFPPLVRFGMARVAPRELMRWASAAMKGPLDDAIAAFGPDVLLAHGIVPWGELALDAATRHGLRCAFVEHSADDVLRLRNATRLGDAVSACARRAECVFVPGAPSRDWLVRTMGWTNVVLLPNGALRAKAPPPPRPESMAGRFVLLSAANYYRRKGLEELVEAVERVGAQRTELQLHLVTNAPRSLSRRVRRSPMAARIHLHAPMAPEELLGWMAWADLFALPSWHESFGLVYAEALAAGTPVLATSDSGFACEAQRWMEEGHPAPALIVPPHDVGAIAAALEGVMRDPQRNRTCAASGAELVAERFTWERNARALLQALRAGAPLQPGANGSTCSTAVTRASAGQASSNV